MIHQKNTVIVIAGPTAVGKTAVAIEVAKQFNTEIISFDSRQCFKELSIGVARPSDEELREVKHHFIASHSIHDKITASSFEADALEKAEELFRKHKVLVMTGGTGLYIKAFCEGLDEVPEVPQKLRDEIVEAYKINGLTWLQNEVQTADPEFYRVGEVQNPQRLIRALEVAKATGRSVLSFRRKEKKKRFFDVIKLGLELPKEQLHKNINSRVDNMIKAGLVEEVQSLLTFKALQTVGYKEVFSYLDGDASLEQAIEQIKLNTRQYAKRQMTWFKKDKEYTWFVSGADAWLNVHAYLEEQL
jgi:tRNA dimethylallyltransferase